MRLAGHAWLQGKQGAAFQATIEKLFFGIQ